MAVHWVNYDLNKSGQDYDKLIEYLKSHEGWAKPVRSSYFVKTSLSAVELRTQIQQHVDSNDAVLVVQVNNASWGSLNIPKEVTDWMQKQLPE